MILKFLIIFFPLMVNAATIKITDPKDTFDVQAGYGASATCEMSNKLSFAQKSIMSDIKKYYLSMMRKHNIDFNPSLNYQAAKEKYGIEEYKNVSYQKCAEAFNLAEVLKN